MKILVVACYSPNINNSAAIESLSYLNALCESGYEVHLLTVDFKENTVYYDKDMLSKLNNKVRIHEVSAGKLFENAVPKLGNEEVVIKKSRIRAIKNRMMIPDAYCFWIGKAYRYYCDNLRKLKFGIMLSMHEPPSSHLVALKIKKIDGIRWIAYFSDPWVLDKSRESIGSLRKYIEGKLEGNVVKSADECIFVTEENKDDFVKRYSMDKDKVRILTRCYNNYFYSEIKNNIKREKSDILKIVYTGEVFTNLRNIIPFLDTINSIKVKDRNLYRKLRIYFYGNVDSDYVTNYMNSIEVLKLMPRVSFGTAIEEILKSDILLVFGNKDSKQIPAKIYDYLGAKSPILTILGDNNDPLKKLCEGIEKCFICENHVLDIEKQLYNIIKNLNKGISYKEEEKYSYLNFIESLKKIVDGLE